MQIYVCIKHVPDTAANIKVVEPASFEESVETPVDRAAIELPPYLPYHPTIVEEYADHLDAIQITERGHPAAFELPLRVLFFFVLPAAAMAQAASASSRSSGVNGSSGGSASVSHSRATSASGW